MRTYAFTLHVKIGDKVIQDGYEAQIEAVSDIEAILMAEDCLEAVPASVPWIGAILRDENGDIVWETPHSADA